MLPLPAPCHPTTIIFCSWFSSWFQKHDKSSRLSCYSGFLMLMRARIYPFDRYSGEGPNPARTNSLRSGQNEPVTASFEERPNCDVASLSRDDFANWAKIRPSL